MSALPCLHEHCRARTIYLNHRNLKEKKDDLAQELIQNLLFFNQILFFMVVN